MEQARESHPQPVEVNMYHPHPPRSLAPYATGAMLLMTITLTGCSALLGSAEAAAPTSTTRAGVVVTTTGASLPPPPTQPTAVSVQPPAYLCEPVTVEDTAFASGSAEIPQLTPQLETVAANLRQLRLLGLPATITIVGHTDNVPTSYPGGNNGLSKARAEAVRAKLVELKVQPDWVSKVDGVGEQEPKAQGNDPASLAKNRRVEIAFLCP